MGGPDQWGPEPLALCLSLYQPQVELGAPGLSHRQDRAAHTQCLRDLEYFLTSILPTSRVSPCQCRCPCPRFRGQGWPHWRLWSALPPSSSAITLPCIGGPGWDKGVDRGVPERGSVWAEGPADGVAGGAPRPALPWAPSGRSWDVRLPAGHLASTQEFSQGPGPESGAPGVGGHPPPSLCGACLNTLLCFNYFSILIHMLKMSNSNNIKRCYYKE